MSHGMNTLELLDANFRIDSGGGQIGMAQELLDEPDIGSVFKHVGGATVAKKMATSGFDSGFTPLSPLIS